MKKSGFGLILLLLGVVTTAHSECVLQSDSSARMTHCKLQLDVYPKPIHVYFSPNHNQKYLVHFHGHNLEGFSHFDKRWGDYGQYLLHSKSEAVLFVPESEGKCATYDSFFSDAIRTKKFFMAIENELKVNELSALSGHSGAYRVLNRLSDYANKNLISFSSIGLFDATYSNIPEIRTYVKEKGILFFDAFVTGPKATTEDISRSLMKELKGDKIFFVPVKGESEESLLDQHFMVLKRGSLEDFFSKASEN